MPSRWARTTASLMERDRPKSSALTMSRRTASGRPIVWNEGASGQPIPGAEDEEQLLRLAHARRRGIKYVECLRFELLEQPPVHRSHQLGRPHRTAVLGRQRLTRLAVEVARPCGEAPGGLPESRRVLQVQNLLRSDAPPLQFFGRDINPSAFRVSAHVAEDVGELKGLAEINRVVAAARVLITEDFDAEQPDG